LLRIEVRVIAFVQGGFSKVGGIETFTSDLLTALRSRQIAADLICWDAGGSEQGLDAIARMGVSVHRSTWRWGCRWGWPDQFMASQGWKRIANADLLVFGKLLHESTHRRLSRLRKRMILITPYRPAEMWKETRPESSILNSFETIIVQASAFEQDLRAMGYLGRIEVLTYLPPEVSGPSLWPQTQLLQVGFLGRLVADKNVEYLVTAFSSLRAMGVEGRLHLYGDGPERTALRTLTLKLGLANEIRFHGSKDRSEIVSAIDRCHMFAFSSITEGQCLAALEVLARGRPVVATPVGAFPEILRDGLGRIAPFGDPDAYATVLKSMADSVLSGGMRPSDVQQAYLRRFDRTRVIDGYVRVFGCQKAAQQEARIA
jgi:glycosyltransferase involved in cell wall biosynthesis